MFTPRKIIEEKLLQLLAEDVGQGDVTTAVVVQPGTKVEASVIGKETGIVAGLEEAMILAESVGLKVKTDVADGDRIKNRQVILRVSGEAQTILSAERTLLNLLSRMSGIATETRRLVEQLQKAGSKAKLAATRKSAPGCLYFDKKAVLIGGGDTHRLHLDDLVLIKDNHLAIEGNVEDAVKKTRLNVSFTKKIEVEAKDSTEALAAAKAGADIIMFDNFSPAQIRKTVKALKNAGLLGKVLLEASGGINSENLLEYAATGVNIVSMGELTQSPRALNISLEITRVA